MDLPQVYKSISPYQRRLVREQYAREQEGNCFWCKEPLAQEPPARIRSKKVNWRLFPKNFLRHPVHLQHDHKTGLTEGAVHAYCNAIMWQFHGR